MAITQSWYDNGGLFQVYGVDQATTENGGEYSNVGASREIDIRIDLTTLNQNEVVQMDNVFFPVGMRIQEIEIEVETAAATGVAIDLGFVRTDRTTEIDFDGLLAAMPTATLTAGNRIVLRKSGTNVGAMVGSGVSTTNVGYITCSATTATAFTAGIIKVRIRYERP